MSRPDAGEPHVVSLLGALTVTSADGARPIEPPPGRASLLLQRLVAASGTAVPMDALVDSLWPEKAPPSASRTVASLVSRLRSRLGADAIVGSPSTGYRFNTSEGRWTSDIETIERLAIEAETRVKLAPALAASAARRALALAEPNLALSLGSAAGQPWVEDLSRHLDGVRRRLRRTLWAADEGLGLWDDLMQRASSAIELDPQDEDAGRALMRAHWELGDRGSALRVYDRLRAAVRAELGVEPSQETDRLYGDVLTDARVAPELPAGAPGTISTEIVQAGRDEPFRRLGELWAQAASGTVTMAMLSGPVGSGRTRLGAELTATVERTGGRVLKSASSEGERSLFLHPILAMVRHVVLSTAPNQLPDLLGPWIGSASELIPELREIVDVKPYQRRSAELEYLRSFQMVEHVLTKLAQESPLLLVFDDLHHAGSSTVEALQWLAHQLPALPFMILTTVQADSLDGETIRELASDSHVIELGPLDPKNVAALAAAVGLEHEASFIWDLTQGHLMFVVEVIEAMRREVPKESISGSLRSVVLDSVGRVGAGVQDLLGVASVVGNTFDVEVLSHIVETPRRELIPLLDTARAAGLVEAREDHFAFSNRVIQEVLYESVLQPIRLDYHRRLAETFIAQPERRAWHLQAAGQVGAAAQSWLEAARNARQTFSNFDAERLYGQAYDAARITDDVAIQGAALVGRGIVREELGRYGDATRDHEDAHSLGLSVGDRKLAAQAVERLGWTAYYERDAESAVSLAEQAAGMPGAQPSALVLLGRIKHWAGDFASASAAYHRALSEVSETDGAVRASALSCLGALLAHNDRYAESIDILDESIELCNEIGAFRPLLRSLFFEGLARANHGDLSGALSTLETKKTLLDRYGVSYYRARTNTCLAWVWRELGQLDRARSLSEQALAESREVEEGELQVEQELHALCSLADCDFLQGRFDTAAASVETASRLLDGWLPFRWRAQLRVTEISVRLGMESAERLITDAQNGQSAKYEAIGLHLAGRPEAAAGCARVTGSSLLIAEVSPAAEAAEARQRLTARLPKQLREDFASAGRLVLLDQL